jgi:hypothetical protein
MTEQHRLVWATEEIELKIPNKKFVPKLKLVKEGDLPGHEFRGNQYTTALQAANEVTISASQASEKARLFGRNVLHKKAAAEHRRAAKLRRVAARYAKDEASKWHHEYVAGQHEKYAEKHEWILQGRKDMEDLKLPDKTALEASRLKEVAGDDGAILAELEEAFAESLEAFASPLTSTIRKALAAGIKEQIVKMEAEISFNLDSPRAVEWLGKHSADLITGISEETREQVRELLGSLGDEGASWLDIVNSLQEKFDEFEGSRARMIAVTEVGEAYEEGSEEVIQELTDAGLEYEKGWIAEENACETCLENEAEGYIPFDEEFPSGDSRPLAHPWCRCDVVYRRVAA